MSDTPKMIIETLCVAQTAIGQLPPDYQSGRDRAGHIAQLQRLIDLYEAVASKPISWDGLTSSQLLDMAEEKMKAPQDTLRAHALLDAAKIKVAQEANINIEQVLGRLPDYLGQAITQAIWDGLRR